MDEHCCRARVRLLGQLDRARERRTPIGERDVQGAEFLRCAAVRSALRSVSGNTRAMAYDYDLLVLGSGPAGQKAAVQAAKLGRKVAVVERRQLGGVSVNRGTIPSKTLREAVLYLTGLSQRAVYGESYRVKEDITVEDLALRTRQVVEREIDIVRNQLARNHVQVLTGIARFVGPHTVAISGAAEQRRVSAEKIVIATGT